MKKKKRIIAGIIIALVIILGVKILTQPTQKERQIAFLKEHEEEMVTFIKKYSSEDEDITFRWGTVEVYTDVIFSNPVLLVNFDISNSSEPKYNNCGYTIRIETNIKKLEKIYDMVVLDNIINANYQEEKNAKSRVN